MRDRRDRAALAVLVGLPVVMFALPALAGFPVMPGDDLVQNYPLRVLAGAQLRQGHLPLLDPYIWSGAPLLGGWNAGALYPMTLLFAVLPGAAAWTVNMMVTWWTAGLGSYAFLRASRLAPAAGFLGALAFAFAGSMTAQLSHFGLVAGMSWVPVGLLALLRLSQRAGRARLAWLLVLASATALVILAGEPRAIDDAAVVLACYAAWRSWRAGGWRERAAYAGLAVAGAALGVALGAVQWMPGIAAVHTSQRAALSAVLFNSGSLPLKWLLLLVVPDLLGGSGSLGQPGFFGTYNLTEVTSYVGLMPLAAACALLGQLRRDRRLPEWIIWHVVALGGVLLALGGRTPLGRVLLHVPFFGAQRLQSRNMMIADLALAVLLAHWADLWLRAPKAAGRRGARSRLLGAVPGAAAVGTVAAAFAWRSRMLRWLGLDAARAALAGPLLPWLAPFAVLGAFAIALAWWGPRMEPGRRTRALIWFASADITVFTLLAVVAVVPGAGRAAPSAAAPSRSVPVGAFTRGGRFAVYDPGLIDSAGLSALGVPDGNVISGTPSVEGYSAIVDGAYAAATGSHLATGDGQDVLALRAIGDGALDQLDTTVLVAPPAYLLTPAGQAPAPAIPGGGAWPRRRPVPGQGSTAAGAGQGAGFRALPPHATTTWYFGTDLPVTSVAVPATTRPSAGSVIAKPGAAAAGLRVGLVRPSGSTDWIPAATGSRAQAQAPVPHPVAAVGVRVAAGPAGASVGPPAVRAAGGGSYRANGALQNVLVPPRWTYTASDDGLAIFSDTMAKPPLTLRAAPGGSTAGASVQAIAGPRFAPASAALSSPRGVSVIRAVADIPGWTATWQPAGGGAARPLAVRRWGLVQAVTAPAGRGVITWRYEPPGARSGLEASLAALAILAGAAAGAATPWRRRREARTAPHEEILTASRG